MSGTHPISELQRGNSRLLLEVGTHPSPAQDYPSCCKQPKQPAELTAGAAGGWRGAPRPLGDAAAVGNTAHAHRLQQRSLRLFNSAPGMLRAAADLLCSAEPQQLSPGGSRSRESGAGVFPRLGDHEAVRAAPAPPPCPPAAVPAAGSRRRTRLPSAPSSLALSPLTFRSPNPRRSALGGSRAESTAVPSADLSVLGRKQDDARGQGPWRSPGEMAGHWAFGSWVPVRSPAENLQCHLRYTEPESIFSSGICLFLLLPVALSLEVSVGKAATIYAVNGTSILLPCTFSSCFGFENLRFWWSYNSSDTFKILIDGTVKNEKSDPKVKLKDNDRITLEGSTKEKVNNISILLDSLEFSDTGKYTCHVRNPKEQNLEHQATIFLQVVDKLEEVDNTVTLIILAVVGGVIGLLVFVLLLKKFITFILKKTREKKKECLVSSSGNDNTENGLPGSKAEEKPPTKV
ncbi:PREDICTED: uncharacterized protein LOC102856887 [Elephantulus edwardii]|uniref:uncharacterized protein LOC102856887 n=1 Tax=Elephantulus edwardii TaxID=28737 RepID=UPI0003F0DFD7|nr:PREDICTED: uncharacterized protein LOC102856887 [Elephantulus edwardii]